MFIRGLHFDNWVNGRDKGEFIHDQNQDLNWEMIEKILTELNGDNKTQVLLSKDEDIHMGIGGGNSGLYNVYATFDNISFFNLLDSSKSEDKIIQLVTGGQQGEFSANNCVDLETMLKAAKLFALEGEINDSLNWQYEE
ncbi:Immunity protein Imm1 [Paenibacillus algorifonticola]|uniref:Immunity protein Imm1 n=1 Tax=Paenibacillus algorifonticola TaxID=684063 RepID=A0A1I2EWY3_9BACL|nr:Imm1 family immunity protein [Paenibacillus algorifonticola]SFE97117.1 Immunity protein Imm1 [Paenibacillus algorifonticola]